MSISEWNAVTVTVIYNNNDNELATMHLSSYYAVPCTTSSTSKSFFEFS